MKKLNLFLIYLLTVFFGQAQNASVEKSIYGIQTGTLGAWFNNESRLTNSIAMRSELGVDVGLFGNFYNETGFLMAPALTLEPRWYYNLNRRVKKSRRIDGNSGNFVSIKITYHPDILIASSEDNVNLISDVSIVPTWGIRRHIGQHFNYETGFGIGYVKYFEEENVVINNATDVAVNLHLRIGYRF